MTWYIYGKIMTTISCAMKSYMISCSDIDYDITANIMQCLVSEKDVISFMILHMILSFHIIWFEAT